MPAPKRTSYLSLETDAEYAARLRASAPNVTPTLKVGARVRKGRLIAHHDEFAVETLDRFDALDSESLDRIGTMCGVQRRLITRDA